MTESISLTKDGNLSKSRSPLSTQQRHEERPRGCVRSGRIAGTGGSGFLGRSLCLTDQYLHMLQHSGRTVKPSCRSCKTAERTVAFGSAGRGRSQKSADRVFSGRFNNPRFSMSSRLSGKDAISLTGNRRATGRPCSVINSSSPALDLTQASAN